MVSLAARSRRIRFQVYFSWRAGSVLSAPLDQRSRSLVMHPM
jgi:hypothetical protein